VTSRRPVPQAARASVATKVITVLAVLTATATAALSGTMAGSSSKLAVILPLTALVGAALSVLALTRFKVFVMCMLVVRSSMDLAKLSGGAEGAAVGTANQQVAARGLDPSSILAMIFIGAAIVWLAAQYRRRGRLPGSPLRRALVVFVAAAAISIIGAAYPAVGALEAMRILAVVLMFVVLEQMMAEGEQPMRQLLLAIYLSLLFPLAFTAFGFLTGHPMSEEKGGFTRITGPFLASNAFGRYLMLMIIFGVAIYPYLEDKRLRRLLAGALTLSSVFLLLTYTRTAIIGVVLGLLVVGLIQSKRLLFGMVVFAICAMLVVPQLSSRFTGLSSSSSFYGPANNSLTWRFGYWTKVLPLANSNPVTGIGLGMTSRQTDEEKQPHNDFIRAYVETGLIGLGAYVAMLISLLTLGRRAVRASPRGSFARGVGAGFLGCAVAFIADSIMANVISSVVTLWYLFAFAAAASAVVWQRRRREEEARGWSGRPRTSGAAVSAR
jgi:putative inorganic carbon (hco3(-)) transporter